MSKPADQQREKILEAATEAFVAAGYEGARVDGIAARAGVNKRLLYHYVGNKRALLEAVLRRQAARVEKGGPEQLGSVVWRLLAEESAHASAAPLSDAVCARRLEGVDPGHECVRLALDMLESLLPALVDAALGAAPPAERERRLVTLAERVRGAEAQGKPRLRLAPTVTRT